MSQGERDGFACLGMLLVRRRAEKEEGLNMLLEASKLGHAGAMGYFSRYSKTLTDLERWSWRAAAAERCNSDELLNQLASEMSKFPRNAKIAFLIGRALDGNVDWAKRRIFKNSTGFCSEVIGPATKALGFYFAQIDACRAAVNTWTVIARQFGVVKDIRRLIGQMIWDERAEAKYDAGKTDDL